MTQIAQIGRMAERLFGRWTAVARFCVVLLPLLGTGSLLPHARAESGPPHIVVVVVDDLRWDEIACAGHPFVRTPHIDRLAREGARFRNAFCTTPLCSPSRASLLTGLHTHHHGILDNTNRSAASHKLATFPRKLQQAGYETAFIGKWHMGNDDTPRPGFDHWICLQGQGTSFDPVLNADGRVGKHARYTTDVLNKLAAVFVRRQRDKPLCLYLAHKALHPETAQRDDGSLSDPGAEKFLPAPRHAQLYVDDSIPRRLNVLDSLEGKPALRRETPGLPPLGRATGTKDETVRDRLRMLAAVDEGVGMLFAALSDNGQLDRTVFVLLSDHGYWYGEHGLSVERRLAYEEAVRIPWLVRYPPLVKPGSVIDEIVLTIDLAPTLLDLARIEAHARADGRSLASLLRGETPSDWRDSFLIEYYSDTVFPRVRGMGYKAIRTKRWKYIRYEELAGMNELYDLKSDPYEMDNLIANPDRQAELRSLRTELDRLIGQKEQQRP